MNRKELESTNITSMCDKESNKHKENLSTYGNKGKEKIPVTSEKKENAWNGYVHIYEYRKQLLRSMYERACTEKYMSISNMEELVEE